MARTSGSSATERNSNARQGTNGQARPAAGRRKQTASTKRAAAERPESGAGSEARQPRRGGHQKAASSAPKPAAPQERSRTDRAQSKSAGDARANQPHPDVANEAARAGEQAEQTARHALAAAASEATAAAVPDAATAARLVPGMVTPAPMPSAQLAAADQVAGRDHALAPVKDVAGVVFEAGARAQRQSASFALAQAGEAVRTAQELLACRSLPQVFELQRAALGRSLGASFAHGQSLSGIGRELWQALLTQAGRKGS